MKRIALPLVLAVAACGSSKKKSGAGSDAPDPDLAAMTGTDLDEEAAEAATAAEELRLRQGKPNGLGAPDEKPAVATEPLVIALVTKHVPWTRFVDPTLGVVVADLADHHVSRLCGAQVEPALEAHARLLGEDMAGGAKLVCINRALVGKAQPFGAWQDDAGASSPGHELHFADCGTDPDMEFDKSYGLLFVPDPVRGLRLAAIEIDEGGSEPGATMGAYGNEVAKTGALCP